MQRMVTIPVGPPSSWRMTLYSACHLFCRVYSRCHQHALQLASQQSSLASSLWYGFASTICCIHTMPQQSRADKNGREHGMPTCSRLLVQA